jgi:NAD+ synthase (glutamine-hydrolysing)
MKLSSLSYIRTAVVSPILRIADIPFNVQQHKQIIQEAIEKGVQFLVFPELSITGYTCGDLFFQKSLLQAAEKALIELASCVPSGFYVIVGAPLRFNSKLYNCGVILEGGTIHYAVPKTYLPNYAEFYEERWFASSLELAYSDNEISLNNEEMIIGFGVGNIFKAGNISFAIEICEDVWSANPPSTNYAANGAVLIANLSASNETVGKADYRRSLVSAHSASTITAYCYASAGACESTTDTVFSGHGIIAENGKILFETDRFTFNSQIAIADIDIDLLQHERVKTSTFGKGNYQECQHIELPAILDREVNALHRQLHKFPFIPIRTSDIDKRYSEILEIQSTALAGRLKHIGLNSVVIGVSGGLDSTLALIACCKAFDKLSLDKKSIDRKSVV